MSAGAEPHIEPNACYSNGLRVECTRRGNCCRNHGDYSFVSLSEADLAAIPPYLGLTLPEFLERYCQNEPGFHVTLRTDAPACAFLREDRTCAIYPVRPKQCATWPFWSENLARATWEGPVKACCPAIDRGPPHSAEAVERIARETDAWYR